MALAIGCTDKPSDPADTDDTNTGTDTATSEQGWTNVCSGMPDDGHEVLYAGVAYHDAMRDTSELTIDTQQDWDVFFADLLFLNLDETLPRDTFDWSTEHIAVSSVFESSTCGMGVLEADSCDIDGQAHLYLAVEDSSSGCESVCDAEGQVMLIVVKPAGETVFNQEVLPGCE